MYTESERSQLLNHISAFVKANQEFECLLQIGSGVCGFTDIYSDIDLMAGCVDAQSVGYANEKLIEFFKIMGAVYLDYRKWSNSVLGISAYFKDGLSVDISFMPTTDMPIKSNHLYLLWSANDKIEDILLKKANSLHDNGDMVNARFHHQFFFKLRKVEIAILRRNYIYADIMLSEARQMLLLIEAMIEGKKIHQFKAFHTLDQGFLHTLQETYPKVLDHTELIKAKEYLLSCYVRLIEKNHLCEIDDSQFKIINCFE